MNSYKFEFEIELNFAVNNTGVLMEVKTPWFEVGRIPPQDSSTVFNLDVITPTTVFGTCNKVICPSIISR